MIWLSPEILMKILMIWKSPKILIKFFSDQKKSFDQKNYGCRWTGSKCQIYFCMYVCNRLNYNVTCETSVAEI